MIDIKKLSPGMTVFEVKKNTGKDSLQFPFRTFRVQIDSVDLEKGEVKYFFNGMHLAFMMQAKNGKLPWRLTRPRPRAAHTRENK